MEVNCTEPSPSVRLPCPHDQILFNALLFFLSVARPNVIKLFTAVIYEFL